MPVVLRIAGFVFFFYSNEGTEPPHVHVRKGEAEAKYWLSPLRLSSSRNMKKGQKQQLEKLVREHRDALLKKWQKYYH